MRKSPKEPPPVTAPTLEASLLYAVLGGDLMALLLLRDVLEEKGSTMLPFTAGECYLVQTPIWYFAGEVAEIGPLHVRFKCGAQIHDTGDFPLALATGKFSSGAEISPLPGEFVLPLIMIVAYFPWPHALPMKRTHKELT
jgi:hypothetical protein